MYHDTIDEEAPTPKMNMESGGRFGDSVVCAKSANKILGVNSKLLELVAADLEE